MKSWFKKEIPLYELLWIFLGVLAAVSLITLTFDKFNSLLALGISFVITLGIIIGFKLKPRIKDARFTWIFLLILLVALGMRIKPWIYLEGGQDEGVYVAMSNQIEKTGSLRFDDIAKTYVPEELKDDYERGRAWHVLGLKKDLETEKLYFDFYPLHPIFLSITGKVLGKDNIAYELTFFSMLTIIGAYLLASELTGKKLTGYLIAGLLTVSPLHLYFSRFPVTEIIALALAFNLLYLLLKAYKTRDPMYLWISLGLISMLMYLRLTFFVALPFCFILAVCNILFSKKKIEKRNWAIWGISVLLLYLLSLQYYIFKQPFLYNYFYGKIFKIISEPVYYIAFLSLPLITFFLVKWLENPLKRFFTFLYSKRTFIFILIYLFLIGFSAYIFYDVAFTSHLAGKVWDKYWEMVNVGWYALKDQAIISVILHLSPFGVLLYLLFMKKINTPERTFIALFAISYLIFNIVVVRFTPYQFYYARYQFSEIIPMYLLIICIILTDLFKEKKVWAYIFTFLLFGYNLLFTVYQFQGYVGTTPTFFHKMKETVTQQDFILYYEPLDFAKSFVLSPLSYYYDVPAMYTKNIDYAYMMADGIKKNMDDRLYFLTTVKLDNPHLTYVNTYTYERGFYANALEDKPPLSWKVNDNTLPFCTKVLPYMYCGGLIPIKYHKGSIDLYLYEYR